MSMEGIDLNIRGVHYRDHEGEARELANASITKFEIDGSGLVTLPAHVLGEILVGNSFDSYIAGLARGLSVQYQLDAVSDAYLDGISEGREIERRKIDGYSD